MIVISSKKCVNYFREGHPESPARILNTHELLRGKYDFIEPSDARIDDILQVHSPAHIRSIQYGTFYDADTPSFLNGLENASLSAGAAINAVDLSWANQTNTFSLMRPPGHHAGKERVMGFCYFNNAAIATIHALNLGGVEKVAILDIDNHHGNGTQEIIMGNPSIFHVDLHKHPEWPGTGEESQKNCINFPLPHSTTPARYMQTLKTALTKIKDFNPNLLIVSAGFDTYKNDPVGKLGLDFEDYKEIATEIRDLGKPVCSILEGGYNAEALPLCILNYLQGLE